MKAPDILIFTLETPLKIRASHDWKSLQGVAIQYDGRTASNAGLM